MKYVAVFTVSFDADDDEAASESAFTELEGAMRLGYIPVVRPYHESLTRFVAAGLDVVKGHNKVATATTRSMALRIMNALNWYKPDARGR